MKQQTACCEKTALKKQVNKVDAAQAELGGRHLAEGEEEHREDEHGLYDGDYGCGIGTREVKAGAKMIDGVSECSGQDG